MSVSKKVVCIVTGKSTVYAGSFLQKKIEEYGSEAELDRLYICREVKACLKKGYKVTDIIKILNVPDSVKLPSAEVIKEIEGNYKGEYSVDTESIALSSVSELTYDKSDPDVELFINKHIIKRL